jgi:hypothetical protein
MFEREHELVSALAGQHRKLWPAARTRVVKAERGYGRGVADLVILDFDPEALSIRRGSGLEPVDVSLAYFIGALRRDGPAGVDRIDRVDRSVSARTNRKAIRSLISTGHVVEHEGAIDLHPSLRPALERVVAVEAKLSDWRGGLLQASRYCAFADQAYLAVPERIAARILAEAPEVPQAMGCGLISVADETARIVVAAPRRRACEAGVRAWAEESELAALAGTPRRLVAPFPPRFAVPAPDDLVAAAL